MLAALFDALPTWTLLVLVPLGLLLAVPVGFLVLFVGAAYWEKRHVSPYVPLDPDSPPPDCPYPLMLSDYTVGVGDGARRAGFGFGSFFAQRQISSIRVAGAVWLSPDRRTLLVSGSGTIMKSAAWYTYLYTPLADGTWLVTTDTVFESDFSGLERHSRLLGACFEELWAAHVIRIAEHLSDVTGFGPGTPFELLAGRTRDKCQRMIDRGVARYRDAARERWSYTALTSLKSVPAFFAQLSSILPQSGYVDRGPSGDPNLTLPASQIVRRWRIPPGPTDA